MSPTVDLVIVFNAGKSKQSAQKAEHQYTQLLDTLVFAGLKAVGRRGQSHGSLLVFVWCPDDKLGWLVQQERHSDFISGIPTSTVPTLSTSFDPTTLSPADRLRLVHGYVTSIVEDGGLGVVPGAPEWDLVESVMILHDHDFNQSWVRAWATKKITAEQIDSLRTHFGDSIALYFSFLSSYTHFLTFPALLGIATHFLSTPYHPLYSLLLVIWSTTFVEHWRIQQRILATRWGTRGSFRVEKRRAQYLPAISNASAGVSAEGGDGESWWTREVRIAASVPIILLFAGVLAGLLTGIFVFEAFVTQLYTGPGQRFIAFTPTLLFLLLVPRLLALYQSIATRLTIWENHAHQSTYNTSLTLKTFVLAGLVAYLGLGLSAFVYVPFGEEVMSGVQGVLRGDYEWVGTEGMGWWGWVSPVGIRWRGEVLNQTVVDTAEKLASSASPSLRALFNTSSSSPTAPGSPNTSSTGPPKLNSARLQDQMFAYTVTNQVVNTFLEVGLPFVLRLISKERSEEGKSSSSKGKRVGFDDDVREVDDTSDNTTTEKTSSASPPHASKEERTFLARVRAEAALPEYDVFGDYSEMVVQFGYVVLWSGIWPLACATSFLNNILEQRSDAFKMTVHVRRPIPARTDTIGPWLDTLSFLAWLGALTNAALVYLFHSPSTTPNTQIHTHAKHHLNLNLNLNLNTNLTGSPTELRIPTAAPTREELFLRAALIALAASHGYILMRAVVRQVLERAVWRGSAEVRGAERREREMKEGYLRSLGLGSGGGEEEARAKGESGVVEEKVKDGVEDESGSEEGRAFWGYDEGLEEIRRVGKEE